jgi:plastocyanin domain-containing protein
MTWYIAQMLDLGTRVRRAGVLLAALLAGAAACKQPPASTLSPPPTAAHSSRVEVAVTEQGFVPSRIPARAGAPLTLVVTRKTDRTCAREILFADREGKTDLPLGKAVEVTYTPKVSGEVKFGCAMGMMVGGVLAVTD